jgi:nucleolar protein 56
MEIVTWFGKVDQETGGLLGGGDADSMIEVLLGQNRSVPILQPDIRRIALIHGYLENDKEYDSRLRDVALKLVRRQLLELTTAEQDLLQAMEALDDISQGVNLLDERLYEWSRLHRQEIVHGKDLAEGLCEDENMGTLAKAIQGLREARKIMEMEVITSAEELAPNLSSLAGPVLAARLISRAGSLRRLAGMPSSRVQIMGAEKSLFKHLKGHAPSPKHGIIYRHPAVIGSPKRLRGKVSRALAGKLAIAARLDYYGAGRSMDLLSSLDIRLDNIKRRGRNKPRGRE